VRKLHPATILRAILPSLKEALRTAVPPLVIAFTTGQHTSEGWIAAVIALFTGLFAIGAFWTTRFALQTDHVVHKTGWIFRKDRRIPLNQIQNVNIQQNVLERVLGVATVDVETAMGRGKELKLSVLALKDAERFREELLSAAHISEAGPAVADEPIVKLTQHDLLYGALTENHLRYIIVGFVTLSGPAFHWLSQFTNDLAPMSAILADVGVCAVMAVGFWLWGSVTYYLKYGGFVVRRDARMLRISFGLFSRVQVAIRPERIEYLHLTTTLLQRHLHRTSLQVGTASSFGEAGVLAPMALALIARELDISVLVGWAFALAASTFCPLLLLGIWWRGLTAAGACSGLVVGGILCGYAVIDRLVVGRDTGWVAGLIAQPAAWTVPASALTMVVVSRLTRHRLPAHVGRFMVRLHTPEAVQLDRS